MFKCRVCGTEYSKLKDVMLCERKCFPEYEKNQKEKRDREIAEDMNKLNTLRQEYIRFLDKVKMRYETTELENFRDLFVVENGEISKGEYINERSNNAKLLDQLNRDCKSYNTIEEVLRYIMQGK